jgi:hypothetical protein
MPETELFQDLKGVFDTGISVVAGVIVGQQHSVDPEGLSKSGTLRITAVIGAAFGDGSILAGDRTLPLQDFYIGCIKKRFDRSRDLRCPCGHIGTIFFPGAEITGNGNRKVLTAAFTPLDLSCIHKSFFLDKKSLFKNPLHRSWSGGMDALLFSDDGKKFHFKDKHG